MTKFVGVDYSMSSPAMCVTQDGTWQNSATYFLTDKPKYAQHFAPYDIRGTRHKLWSKPEQRYEQIAVFFIELLSWPKASEYFIAIEDYSMGSVGKVFHIAENTGLLKYMLWKYGFNFVTIPPTQIKKFATGMGNAKKEQMLAAFKVDTFLDLSKIMGQEGKLDSPVTDIVDAWYIAKYAKVLYEQNSQGPNQTQSQR